MCKSGKLKSKEGRLNISSIAQDVAEIFITMAPNDGWSSSRARRELVKLVSSGEIHEDLSPEEACCICQLEAPDAFRHHPFENRFPERLEAILQEVERDQERAEAEKQAMLKDRQIFPKKPTNHRGEPRWEGSEAERLLKLDIDANMHQLMKPKELRTTRPEYEEFLLTTFRKHIHQETRSRKFIEYCKAMSQKKYDKSEKKAKTAQKAPGGTR